MPKILKRITFSVIGFVGVLVAAAFILPSFVDWNSYRTQVESIASNMLNQEVAVEGDIAVTLLPFPKVIASSVRIPAANGEADIATVAALKIKINAFALLFGDVSIREFELEKPSFTMVETDGNGWQVLGLSEKEDAEESSELFLKNLLIRDGALSFVPLSGTVYTVNNFNMDFSGTLPTGPMVGVGDFSFQGIPINYDARLQPLSDGVEQSLKITATSGGNVLELTGRLMEDERFNGRLTAKADKASELGRMGWAVIGENTASILPDVPMFVDLRINKTANKIEIDSKRVQMGNSEGRLDLLILGQENKQFSGTLALGTIDLDIWALNNINSSNSTELAAWPATLSGQMDVTVEALMWHGQLVRQVDISVKASQQEFVLEKAQALVPGGGELSMGGKMPWSKANVPFTGKLGLKTSRLRDFLTWMGTDISRFPADKIIHLNWLSNIEVSPEVWSITNVDAKFDDSQITGMIAGRSDGLLTTVDLSVDRFNLDAYAISAPAKTQAKAEEETLLLPEKLTVKIDALTFSNIVFDDVAFKTVSVGRSLAIQSASGKGFGGALSLKATIENIDTMSGISGSFSGTSLSYDKVRVAFPALQGSQVYFAGPLTLDAEFSGDLKALTVKTKAALGDDSYSGTLALQMASFSKDGLKTMALDGVVAFSKNNKLFQTMVATPLNKGVNLAVKLNGDVKEAMGFELSGIIIDSQMTYKGQITDLMGAPKINGAMVFSMPQNSNLQPRWANGLLVGPMTFAGDIHMDDKSIGLTKINAKQGNAVLTGNVTLGRGDISTIDGALELSNLQLQTTHATDHSKFADDWKQTLFPPLPLRFLRGSVALQLQNVMVYGQTLNKGKATFNFNENGMGFTLAEATLNDAAASMTTTLTQGAGQSLNLDMDVAVANMFLEPFTQAMFGKVINNANGGFSLKISGNGRSEYALVRTLRGEGSVTAKAGTLRFMDVPKLMTALKTSNSRGAFLSGLTGLLDKGQSHFSDLVTRFKIERGVATVEPLTATGGWGTLNLPGTFNIADRVIDLKGLVTFADSAELAPIKLGFSGPITAPKANYDTAGLLNLSDILIGKRIQKSLEVEQKNALDKNGGEVEPAGKLFDMVRKVLEKTKEKPKETNGQDDASEPPATQKPE